MTDDSSIENLTTSMAALWRASTAMTRVSVLINTSLSSSEPSKWADARPSELSARMASDGVETRSASSVAATFPSRVLPELFSVVATDVREAPVQARGVFLTDVGVEASLDAKSRGSRFERLLQTVYDRKVAQTSTQLDAAIGSRLDALYAPDALVMANRMVDLLIANNVRLVRSQARLLEEPQAAMAEGRPRMLAIADWLGCVLPDGFDEDAVVATVELKTAADAIMPSIQNCIQALYQAWLAKQLFKLADYPPAYICQVSFSTMGVSLVKLDPAAVIRFIHSVVTPAPGFVRPAAQAPVAPLPSVAAPSVNRPPTTVALAPTPIKQVLSRIKQECTANPVVFVVGFLNLYKGEIIITARSVAAAVARTASLSRLDIDAISDTMSARDLYVAHSLNDVCNISRASWLRMLDCTESLVVGGAVVGMWSTAFMQGDRVVVVTP